ncbi:MAG: ATP-binding protein [Deltaproteobacteria bacterium]|nr:ATP-binding protein [Deltaproteobacteria bacterium]
MTIDFENALRRSRIETPRYEFKQGILKLDISRSIDQDLLVRIVETACGIANLGPDSDGYIFFGVADREAHADRISTLDGIQKRKFAEHFLVGIDREAIILGISLDEYTKKLVTAFQMSKMTEPLRTQILSSFDTITIHGLTCVRIRIPKQTDMSFVDGKAYYRENSNTIEIQGQKLLSISKLFIK